jgi:HK97 family phage major capsid protein
MDELKKAIEELKAQLAKGYISQEDFQTKMKEFSAKLEAAEAQLKDVQEMLRKRMSVMSGLEKDIENGTARFSVGRFLDGVVHGRSKSNEEEFKIVEEYMTKTAHSTTGSGQYSIPPQAIMTFIEKLYAMTVLKQAGATIMTGLSGSPVTIPRHSGSTTGYWIAEGAEITESSITDQQISMTPKEAAGLVTLNNKLLALSASNPAIENLIMNDLATQIALLIDLAGLRSTGGSNDPVGILGTASILTNPLGTDGDYFKFDDVIDLEGKLEDANSLRGNLAFITNPKVKRRLRKQKVAQYTGDTAGQPLLWPMSDASLKDALGYPMLTTTQIPATLTKGGTVGTCSEVYFGNFADLIIGQWGGLDFATSNQAGDSFKKNQTQIRAIQMVDFAVRHPESFVVIQDAKTV